MSIDLRLQAAVRKVEQLEAELGRIRAQGGVIGCWPGSSYLATELFNAKAELDRLRPTQKLADQPRETP